MRGVSPSRVAFFVADAVGHGVPAALLARVLTSSLLSAAAASGTAEGHSPARVLARLNERLCASCLGTGRFATAVYGVIDAETRKVTVAGAGHPLPILLSGGDSSEIETAGPLLGVFDDAEFDQREVSLADDDMLMLYTDGLDAAFPLEASGAQRAVLNRLDPASLFILHPVTYPPIFLLRIVHRGRSPVRKILGHFAECD